MTIGRGSFLSELIERAGGENLFADVTTSSGVVSIEAVAARNPDLILATTEGPAAFATQARVAGGASGATAPVSPGERLGVQPAESPRSVGDPRTDRADERSDPVTARLLALSCAGRWAAF